VLARPRRRARADLVVLAEYAAGRLQSGPVVRIGAGLLTLLLLLTLYLVLAAQTTAASYQIQQLQMRQQQQQAELEQWRYQVARLQGPASVDAAAAAGGLQRVPATAYLTYQPINLNLSAPIGKPLPDTSAIWQRGMLALIDFLASHPGGR
jgi:hypothetical protein